MSEWKENRLGKVAPFKYGKALTSEKRTHGEFNVFSSAGICGKSEIYLAKQGIIIGRKGSVGTVYYSDKPFFCIDTAFYIDNIDSQYDMKFLYYYIKLLHLESYNNDAAVPGLNRNLAEKLKITCPDLQTQNRIADILSAYDDLIENNNKRIKLLEQMAENLYKEWFVRFRFPGYENAEFENGIPKGWSNSKADTKIPKTFKYGELQELGIFTRGKNLTASQMIDGNIPVISAGVEPSGYHNKANISGISLTISSSGANAGYLKYNLENIWAADCSYYQNDENIWFIYNTLKYLQLVIKNMQCGAAQPHVYPKHINRLCILIPTEELIKNYNNVCNIIYNEIRNINKQINNLTQQRDLLLPRLISGKLEVE